MRTLIMLAALLSMVATDSQAQPDHPSALESAPQQALDWTIGTWVGARIDGSDGSRAAMTMRVEPILDGTGQVRHIEVVHGGGTYRGFAVQVFDAERAVWVRQYTSQGRGRFASLEGTVEEGRSVWRSVTPDRQRESKLVSERPSPKTWKRTMHVSEDGGTTWRVLWVDQLERASR